MLKDQLLGQTISHYTILDYLGGGGMGRVYKAEDTKLKRVVALKFLPVELTQEPQAKARFIHEAQAASALDHPRIGTIYEINETRDGHMFIAMAYYEGETLAKKISRGAVSPVEAVEIVAHVAYGLATAHEKGIVHRDIKPANIIITHDGFIKIVDFGLAKLGGATRITKEGTSMGTPAYMSPEQVKGLEVDHRTDIWSLGLILYELMTGKLPFRGDNEMTLLYNIVNEEAVPASQFNQEIPPPLEEIVAKAMAKNVADRYGTMNEFFEELNQIRPRLEPREADVTRTIISQDLPLAIPKLTPENVTRTVAAQDTVPIAGSPEIKTGRLGAKFLLPVLVLVALIVLGVLNRTKIPFLAPSSRGNQETIATENPGMANTEKQAPVPLTVGSIMVKSDPPGAAIFLDERNLGKRTPATLENIQVGLHRVRLQLAGYKPLEQAFTISAEEVEKWEVDLSKPVGAIIVESTPPGADIFIDGRPTGKTTSATLNGLDFGAHVIELRKDGYESFSGPVTVREDEAATLAKTLIRVATTLLVTSQPVGADISIDGKASGYKTPYTIKDLESGDHAIELTLDGHLEAKQRVAIEAGEDNKVAFNLRAEPLASLTVLAFVKENNAEVLKYATITVDGVDYGQTPKTVALKKGTYSIEAKLFGHSLVGGMQEVTLQAGQEKTLRFEFRKS